CQTWFPSTTATLRLQRPWHLPTRLAQGPFVVNWIRSPAAPWTNGSATIPHRPSLDFTITRPASPTSESNNETQLSPLRSVTPPCEKSSTASDPQARHRPTQPRFAKGNRLGCSCWAYPAHRCGSKHLIVATLPSTASRSIWDCTRIPAVYVQECLRPATRMPL